VLIFFATCNYVLVISLRVVALVIDLVGALYLGITNYLHFTWFLHMATYLCHSLLLVAFCFL
jgi:hypothetical protein